MAIDSKDYLHALSVIQLGDNLADMEKDCLTSECILDCFSG